MSIYFVTSDGRDLWNPSSFTAQLFCDQAESIARHLGVDSGLGPIVSDAVVVSELSFVSFAQSFAVQLSQVDLNTTFGPDVFRVTIPPGFARITLEDVRRAGPLGRRPSK